MSNNKRITELVPLNPAQLADNDLFAVADVSIPDTKKITVTDFAQWVANSASLSIDSASYSDTASYLLYQGFPNGTASYAISSSWAYLAYSASFVISASYAVTASYCLSCGTTSSYASGAISCLTASYLLYQGFPNGTASYALTSSRALFANTASYIAGNNVAGTVASASYAVSASTLIGIGGLLPTTASWALRAITASYLYYDGATNNGTASYAVNAKNSQTASMVTSLANSYIFREFGPHTSSIFGGGTTASFGYFQITASALDPRVIVEAWGDVRVKISSSIDYSGSLVLNLSESISSNFDLDTATFQYYITKSAVTVPGEDAGGGIPTGSVICRFYMKGTNTNASAHRYLVGLYAHNGLLFETGSDETNVIRSIRCSVKANTDLVVDE